MFELSIALKYLIPRRGQLSVSIISLISTLVIALVVWLIVVFFSVKDGLENGWLEKIVSLTAPVRLVPKEAYYKSYYYLIDTISDRSGYTSKTLGEKLLSSSPNPYNALLDEEIPPSWPPPLLNEEGNLKDLVQLAVAAVDGAGTDETLTLSEYETAPVSFVIFPKQLKTSPNRALEYPALLSTIDTKTPSIVNTFIPPSALDFDHATTSPSQALQQLARFAYVQPDRQGIVLPQGSEESGEPLLVPKGLKDHGIALGDTGYLSYYTPSLTAVQEQRLPVFVSGFYDPGIIPTGGKLLLSHPELVSLIRSNTVVEPTPLANGFNIRFENFDKAAAIKLKLEKELAKRGLTPYWNVLTYEEYEFTKDIVQQLKSEKNLFSLISLVIIIVACSNIISMLIILVNDKKLEIGILRSMGATSKNIATIFGCCGFVMGAMGSVIGIAAALATLHYINELVHLMSYIQGHDLFNPVFYGETLPSAMSQEALLLVTVTTAAVSLIAGVVPAVKACLMRPAAILRAE